VVSSTEIANMLTKLLEIRDEGTCIPAMASEAIPANPEQRAILGRAGYGHSRCIILQHLHKGNATYNAHDWSTRTYVHAHLYIIKHWDDLSDGDVIDVQFILGERAEKKVSEIQGQYA
jgi:hypothetical protein